MEERHEWILGGVEFRRREKDGGLAGEDRGKDQGIEIEGVGGGRRSRRKEEGEGKKERKAKSPIHISKQEQYHAMLP